MKHLLFEPKLSLFECCMGTVGVAFLVNGLYMLYLVLCVFTVLVQTRYDFSEDKKP